MPWIHYKQYAAHTEGRLGLQTHTPDYWPHRRFGIGLDFEVVRTPEDENRPAIWTALLRMPLMLILVEKCGGNSRFDCGW